MNSSAFVAELERASREHLHKIDQVRDASCALSGTSEMVRRLKLALRQELEAAEIGALWMPTMPAVDMKLALGRLCGDESKHYRLIARRLGELGEDVTEYDPFAAAGPTRLYEFFASLTDPVERIAAANFTRESIGYVRNQQFIEYCEASNDTETARLYREDIQPDEKAHADLGRELLIKYAIGDEVQARARAAAMKTLEMAEGAVAALIANLKMSHGPGC